MVEPFTRNYFDAGLVILLRDEVDLFHDLFILPFAFLHRKVLNIVLVLNVLSRVRHVGFPALSLERR